MRSNVLGSSVISAGKWGLFVARDVCVTRRRRPCLQCGVVSCGLLSDHKNDKLLSPPAQLPDYFLSRLRILDLFVLLELFLWCGVPLVGNTSWRLRNKLHKNSQERVWTCQRKIFSSLVNRIWQLSPQTCSEDLPLTGLAFRIHCGVAVRFPNETNRFCQQQWPNVHWVLRSNVKWDSSCLSWAKTRNDSCVEEKAVKQVGKFHSCYLSVRITYRSWNVMEQEFHCRKHWFLP